MRLTVVTNIAAPYRDAVFCEVQSRMDGVVFFLADDEPDRNWAGRRVDYLHRRAPAISIGRARKEPHYIALPTWIARRGWILISGFGQPAIVTALLRPASTLLWTEATRAADETECGALRTKLRAWLVRRCRACVAVGEESTRYCELLGARDILVLPNVHDTLNPAPPSQAVERSAPPPHTQELVLAHVGDWSHAKGADRTTEVFSGLRSRLGEQGITVRLVIAGHTVDAPRPAGSVYLGYLPSEVVWERLAEFSPRFLLLMSRRERWGFVVSEAMARGVVPVVTPEVGAGTDLVRPLGTHLISRTSAEAVDAIVELYTDADAVARVSAQARALIQTRTAEWAVHKFETGLDKLVAQAA